MMTANAITPKITLPPNEKFGVSGLAILRRLQLDFQV
jgi:hypothetical protein